MADNPGLFGLFSPETGTNISRAGAALGGRLGEFDERLARTAAATQKRTDEQQQKRRRAMLIDNRQVRRFLEAGNVDSAKKLLTNRIENVVQFLK